MQLRTGGELVAVDSKLVWASRLIDRAAGGSTAGIPDAETRRPTVRLTIQAGTTPFDRAGMRPVTRGAWSDGRRTVLVDACGSGFDLLVAVGDELAVTARYRPRHAIRAANRVLASRFALLAGQVLVHYPVLWRAGWRGRVPLHASVARSAAGTPLLAGPGGVGKSTVLARALADGAAVTADNLCCADPTDCFGLAEPLRVDSMHVHGASTSHGRIETRLTDRAAVLRPDRLVVLERGTDTQAGPLTPGEATRALVAGTYAAGELRRYWAFAATLALATGRGPAHPPITEVAAGYAERLPCWRVRVGDDARISLDDLCGTASLDLLGGPGRLTASEEGRTR